MTNDTPADLICLLCALLARSDEIAFDGGQPCAYISPEELAAMDGHAVKIVTRPSGGIDLELVTLAPPPPIAARPRLTLLTGGRW